MKSILSRGFDVHISFLHVFGFLFLHQRKSLAFGAHNLIISVAQRFLVFLYQDERKWKTTVSAFQDAVDSHDTTPNNNYGAFCEHSALLVPRYFNVDQAPVPEKPIKLSPD